MMVVGRVVESGIVKWHKPGRIGGFESTKVKILKSKNANHTSRH